MRARLFDLPRADAYRLRWEMFWPCVVLTSIGALGLGWGFAPLVWGVA